MRVSLGRSNTGMPRYVHRILWLFGDSAGWTVPAAVGVVGGGLSGLTAALRLLESGVRVVLVDKKAFRDSNAEAMKVGYEDVKHLGQVCSYIGNPQAWLHS